MFSRDKNHTSIYCIQNIFIHNFRRDWFTKKSSFQLCEVYSLLRLKKTVLDRELLYWRAKLAALVITIQNVHWNCFWFYRWNYICFDLILLHVKSWLQLIFSLKICWANRRLFIFPANKIDPIGLALFALFWHHNCSLLLTKHFLFWISSPHERHSDSIPKALLYSSLSC